MDAPSTAQFLPVPAATTAPLQRNRTAEQVDPTGEDGFADLVSSFGEASGGATETTAPVLLDIPPSRIDAVQIVTGSPEGAPPIAGKPDSVEAAGEVPRDVVRAEGGSSPLPTRLGSNALGQPDAAAGRTSSGTKSVSSAQSGSMTISADQVPGAFHLDGNGERNLFPERSGQEVPLKRMGAAPLTRTAIDPMERSDQAAANSPRAGRAALAMNPVSSLQAPTDQPLAVTSQTTSKPSADARGVPTTAQSAEADLPLLPVARDGVAVQVKVPVDGGVKASSLATMEPAVSNGSGTATSATSQGASELVRPASETRSLTGSDRFDRVLDGRLSASPAAPDPRKLQTLLSPQRNDVGPKQQPVVASDASGMLARTDGYVTGRVLATQSGAGPGPVVEVPASGPSTEMLQGPGRTGAQPDPGVARAGIDVAARIGPGSPGPLTQTTASAPPVATGQPPTALPPQELGAAAVLEPGPAGPPTPASTSTAVVAAGLSSIMTGPGASIPHHIAQHIAANLPKPVADLGNGTLELALDPPELGRVRMSLLEIGGALTLSITAERPETAELMRRNMDLLNQEFSRSGLDAPNVQVSTGEDGQRPSPNHEGGSNTSPHPEDVAEATGDNTNHSPSPSAKADKGRALDLRL
jgi:flagellar hook-length control protein FliK